jgi:glycine/D-amino acid oxidase-like deaminating enzyme/nitrite reductase/ring-hydroxylating ferredoxin subunit
MNTPFWPQPVTNHPVDVPADAHVDVAVVGAGFTGLITAVLLAEEGRSVAVLEAREIGAGASGSTTAKTTLLQGTRLSTLARTHSADVAADYLAAHRFGQDWLRRFCADNAVDVHATSAFTYAPTEDSAADVRREYEVAQELGLPVILRDNLVTPFPVHTAVELPEQFQLNPADLLAALVRRATDAGATVTEGARVTDLTADDEAGRVTVTTTAGDMTAGHVVLATATPILDKGRTTMSLVPQRSYLCAYDPAPGSVLPDGMFLSVGSPGISLRTYLDGEEPRLLVGGAGHRTGQSRDTNEHIAEIDAWTHEHFPGARRTHSWSAQDYHPIGMVPLAETLSWGAGLVHFAGAYSKWGMTGAPAAARRVVDVILGRPEQISFGSPSVVGAAATTATQQAGAVTSQVSNIVDAVRDRGRKVSRVCPHMGGTLAWNDAEQSWDCPLHGSRFTEDGALLEGPATQDLKRL